MDINHIHNPKQKLGNSAIFFLLLTFLFFLYWSSSYPSPLVFIHNDSVSEDGLEEALEKASMRNKTLIVAVINKAYAEQDLNGDTTMLDLFLTSFWLGEGTRSLLDHVLIVAADRTAYDRCRFLRLNCFRLETEGVDFEGEKMYMSEDFIKMMWARTFFLLDVLKRGYNFIFTDTDIMWLRNPFLRLGDTEDLQISTDKYHGNPLSEKHQINSGFYFIRSNNKTISLLETWYSQKDNSTGKKEQDVLQDLITQGIIKKLGLSVRFMDTLYFSGFCQDSKDLRAVTTVHANCCRSITAKTADLKAVLRDWKHYKKFALNSNNSEANNFTHSAWWTRHYKCQKSWKLK